MTNEQMIEQLVGKMSVEDKAVIKHMIETHNLRFTANNIKSAALFLNNVKTVQQLLDSLE